MILMLKRLFGKKKQAIYLALSRYYPENHSKAGQKTHFGSKIIGSGAIKKHQVCMDTGYSDKIGPLIPVQNGPL